MPIAAPTEAPPIAAAGPDEETGGLQAICLRLDRRLPVADQVHEALRAAIVGVHLLPGTPISENSISRQFGVSRTPIRAAIQRLAEEGLIDVYPQQGSFVAPIRLSGIGDAHFVRRALEVAVLRETAEIWTPAMSAAARAVPAKQRLLLEAGDLGRLPCRGCGVPPPADELRQPRGCGPRSRPPGPGWPASCGCSAARTGCRW